jgi:hypothetical protein
MNVTAYRSEKDRARIRDILMRDWDPIGVQNIPGAPEDEYDAYVHGVRALLAESQVSQEKIAAYLLDIQSRKMFLRVTPAAVERCNRTATHLVAAVLQSSLTAK